MVKVSPVSIKQRLHNHARSSGRVYNTVLIAYGLQRLIYRLSVSKHANDYILKGGMLVTQWTLDSVRPTKDLDFLGFGDSDADHLIDVFSEVMELDGDDGLNFDTATLAATPIRDTQDYGGIRLKTTAYLDKTKIPITIDVGFGDAIVDPDYRIDYPSLLDMPPATLRAYPPESVIAEKFHAVVALGLINSRMKDYYDLWSIPQALALNEDMLDKAIAETFKRRGHAIPTTCPPGFSDMFAEDAEKKRQWAAYAESVNLENVSLQRVTEEIWDYLAPACARICKREET
ncbi:nucleotidyl transferase AbiEii/AbiGii toxin family protein [Kordiimonas pumila]|uniref:Nucleotidyl transferase AbiEii/AbiGii toxin family protein n=1 Tax=Kordiimonas pumila TaxID=2161677 RepID=A0ABV7D662_9PROT|nr:nucleotidyl transferase AbiEii/AbiGii toxin family protein [Kordiimonas pumila]